MISNLIISLFESNSLINGGSFLDADFKSFAVAKTEIAICLFLISGLFGIILQLSESS